MNDEEIERESDQAGDQNAAQEHDNGRRQHWRRDDDGKPEQHGGHEFGADRVARIDQRRAGEHAFEYLRVHLDTRKQGVERRRLGIEEPDRRGTNQHELAVEPVGRHTALQHVLGGNVAGGIVLVEMDPELPVLVGRHFEARHCD
jgi:hypothetical protein